MRGAFAVASAASVSWILAGCGTAPTPAPTPAPLECIAPAPTPSVAAPTPAPFPEVEVLCPSENDDTAQRCLPGVCCPGFSATSGMTFPCPTSPLGDDDTNQCECGRECVVDALLNATSREEKYGYIRGTGWNDYAVTLGYYIGNAGGGLYRYGVPSLNMHDSGNGFNNIDITQNAASNFNVEKDVEQVTTWPVSLNLASLWSEDYAARYGEALAQEFRAKGANVLLGPAVETHRVPRGGRNAEYISGESPYLGARLVKPYIRAVQSQGVLASVKHFVGNQQETCRRESNSIIDRRTRYEMYYPQFEAAMQADVAVVMCGYNQVNGDWNCGSEEVLKYDLRESLGFGGFVQSDWWAFHSFEMGFNGGVDQEMPGTGVYGVDDRTTRYTDEKLNTQTDEKIDSMVRPQLDYLLKYGLAEPSADTCQMGSCTSKLVGSITLTAERQALAKEITTESVTLLKNEDSVLPLAEKGLKIAVLGAWCDESTSLGDGWNAWYARNPLYIGGSGRSFPKHPVTVFDSMITACSRTYDVAGVATPYCTVQEYRGENAADAISAAAGADVAIFCGEVATGEETDRDNLQLWGQDFHVAVSSGLAASMPVVALLMTPGSVIMPWIDSVKSVMTLFAPGKVYGDAFTDNIFGYHNPSAKTPVFYPVSEAGTIAPSQLDGCSQANILDITYSEGLNVGWHGADPTNVLFPFGHGLSYTTFDYSDAVLHSSSVSSACPDQDSDRGEAVLCITALVSNSGSVNGVEIAQLYMGFPEGLGEPPKVLRGFQRLQELTPGQCQEARFPIYARDLMTYSADDRQWENNAGTYTFYIGASSADDALMVTWEQTQTRAVSAFV